MAVPANIIIAWPSTVASIPAGWTRETTLDGKYIQGAPAAGNADLTARGNATHVHTSPAHTPVQLPHVHNLNAGDADTTIVGRIGSSGASSSHIHPLAVANLATATNNSSTITVDATSNDLAYTDVIFIKSDGSPVGFPTGAWVFYASDTLPGSWSRVSGNGYLRGAAAAGNGGATGGSNTHTHTSPAHTHTQNSHTHTADSGQSSGSEGLNGAGPATFSTNNHTHTLSVSTNTATNQAVTTAMTSESHEPLFKKLNVIANGGATSLPGGAIALWASTAASIPSGWSRYTAMDGLFLKGANANGEIGTTGGATTHTHTADDCQPVQNSHTHTITDGGAVGTVTRSNVTLTVQVADPSHTHTWTDTGKAATNIPATVTINVISAEDAYPPYVRLIFIQNAAAPAGPSIGGYTSYDLGLFDIGDPFAERLPEEAARAWAGDPRYLHRE